MKLIIEQNCYNLEEVKSVTPQMEAFLMDALKYQSKISLDYFVIADDGDENFAQSVKKYAALVGTDTNITQDGSYLAVGKSLNGIDEHGELHQAIVIKSSLWVCAANELFESQTLQNNEIKQQINMPEKIASQTILHELGHVIDNENQYRMFGEVNTKVRYDLRYEYDEYAKETALSLWGEYHAELFACIASHVNQNLTKDNEENLIECIRSYSFGLSGGALLERVYRILYFFVLRIACVHSCGTSFDYKEFEQSAELSVYVHILKDVEFEIIKLLDEYPNWPSKDKVDVLSKIFKKFITFEHDRQNRNTPQTSVYIP